MSIGARIKEARGLARLTQQGLADELGVSRSAVALWETDSNAPTADKIGPLSKVLGQSAEWILSGRGVPRVAAAPAGPVASTNQFFPPGVAQHRTIAPDMRLSMRQVPVIGYVQAGVWLQTVELPPADRFDIPLPIQAGFDGFVVQGLVVRGPSMDEVYPHGSILAVVSFLDLGREPRNGERVVALRHRHGETEATVKEYRIGKDGRARLWPRSGHPDFQQPVTVDPPNGDDEELQIAYLVIGSYRPEV